MQRLASGFALLLLLAATTAQAVDFRPVFDGTLQQFHLLPDDRLLISGIFKQVNGRHCPNLCRLNPAGSIDSGFGPVFLRPNPASALLLTPPLMAVQADGKILIFGELSSANDEWTLNYSHKGHMLRITDSGLLDDSFRIPQLGHAPSRSAAIRFVALLDDGRLLVGGSFNSINGVDRRNLARLLPNGEVDPGFNANLSLRVDPDNLDSVELISIDNEGKLPVVTHGIAGRGTVVQRLNADGSLDPTFGTLPLIGSSRIRSLIALPGQQLLVGGLFAFGEGDLHGIARLDATGLVDPSFQAHTPDRVHVMKRMNDGRVLVGGELAEFNGSSVRRLVRILPGGLTDVSFSSPIEQGIEENPSFSTISFAVRDLAVDSLGNILVGGSFQGADNQIQARLLKLNASGALLRAPDPQANDTVFTFALQPDGHVLIGGRFTEMGGQSRAHLARLKPDGSLDPDFTTGTSSTVRAIGVQRDGKLVIAGAFGTLANQPRSRIGRLNPDGSLDPNFNPNVTNSIRCLAIQADDAILIGGILTAVGGVPRPRLARLHPDGSLDLDFNPAPNGEVRSITVDRLGRILVAGSFTIIGGVEQANLARLHPDGSVDTDFVPVIDAEVRAVAIEAKGSIRISGLFSTVNAAPRAGVAVLVEGGALEDVVQHPNFNIDGPVHASISYSDVLSLEFHRKSFHVGDFSTAQGQPRAGFVAFLRSSFEPENLTYHANNNLYAMLATEDGRLLLGGDFSTINSVHRSRLATVHSRSFSQNQLGDFSSQSPVFLRRRGPHLEHPMHFEYSLDGIEFTPFDSTVKFTPPAQNYYMRISGRSRAGYTNSSSGLIEIIDYLPGRGITIFRDAFQ